MARDIRRTVKLLLDKLSAKRVEKDISDALDKGTDPKKPTKNLKAVEKGLGGLKKAAIAVGAAFVAAFAAGKVLRFLKDATQLAADSEEAWTRLAGKVENAGVSFAAVEADLRRMSDAMAEQTTLGRDEYADVLGILIGLTNDYALSVQNVDLVTDFAAATGKTFVQSAEAIGKALQGDTKLLKELNIEFQAGTDIVEVLRERFAGFSENEAKTFNGRVRQLGESWRFFKVQIGEALIESGAAETVFDALSGSLRDMTKWVQENDAALAHMATTIANLIVLVGKLGAKIVETFTPIEVLAVQDFVDRLSGTLEERAEAVFTQIIRLKAELQEFNANAIEVSQKKNALAALEAQYKTLMEAALAARQAVSGGGGGGRRSVLVPGEPGEIPGAPGVFPATLGLGRDLAGGDFGLGIGRGPVSGTLEGQTQAQIFEEMLAKADEWLAKNDEIVFAAHAAAQGFANAWEDAFTMLFAQGADFGTFMQEVFEGVATAALDGIAVFARGKVQENIAAAIEQVALGIANPLGGGFHFAAAAKHGLAAAAWGVLAGASGGAANAVAGAGGGGSSGVSEGGADTRPLGPEINIFIDPLDPSSARYQQNVDAAFRYARERFGDDSRFSVRRTR